MLQESNSFCQDGNENENPWDKLKFAPQKLFSQEQQLVSIAILAGGKSKRMGQDKAFLPVGKQIVIERVIERVRPLTDDLYISTNTPEAFSQFNLPMVADIHPNKAALGGIYSAISAAQHQSVLIVACDMPFLNVDLLSYLIKLSPTANVVAPLINPPQPETLHTVYGKTCLPAIEKRLLANKLRIIGFFDDVTVRYVEQKEIAAIDPNLYSFVNMNTPQDLERVRKLANVVGC